MSESIHIGTVFEEQTRTFGTLDLFLFSAAIHMPQRIHYDRDYARQEGHDDVLVHGPLQAICLVQNALGGLGQGWHLRRVQYRNHKPVYVNVPFVCVSRIADVDASGRVVRVELAGLSHDGHLKFISGELDAERMG